MHENQTHTYVQKWLHCPEVPCFASLFASTGVVAFEIGSIPWLTRYFSAVLMYCHFCLNVAISSSVVEPKQPANHYNDLLYVIHPIGQVQVHWILLLSTFRLYYALLHSTVLYIIAPVCVSLLFPAWPSLSIWSHCTHTVLNRLDHQIQLVKLFHQSALGGLIDIWSAVSFW